MVALLGTALLLFGANLRVKAASAPFVRRTVESLPATGVGVVLGCRPELADGRPNLFFVTRIRAAVELYRSGKVTHLIASGDNGHAGYDEPTRMKQALMEAGVPASHISRDFAGFRTLDSVLRARDVFGVHRLTFISQRFHVERAVYLARANGIDAYALAASDVGGAGGALVQLRELFSRAVALLDVNVFHTRPRFAGPPLDLSSAP